MRELQGESQLASQSEPEVRSEAIDTDNEKKSIDEMIEEFKRANPEKNPKRMHRGIF